MSYLDGGKVIDLMFGLPDLKGLHAAYESFKPLYRDRESQEFAFPAQYMFKDIPNIESIGDDPVGWAVKQMDRFNIEKALIGVHEHSEMAKVARDRFADRFIFDVPVDPNRGMEEVRRVRRLAKEYDIRALTVFPCGCVPQVPIDDKRMYVMYALCVDMDVPIFVNVGVPGPRVPMDPQKVERVDEVCWFFPELKFVMRHGAEPWDDLAVKLMLEISEPVLLDERVRPQALSQVDHPLRQYARRRQNPVCRLFPDGPEPGPHLFGAAQRAVQRGRLAEIPL